jgi:hypothetical protein
MRSCVRGVVAVTAGFLAMSGFAFLSFTLALAFMDEAPRAVALQSSGRWVAVSACLGVLSAGVGGVVCGAIARGARPVYLLAVCVAGFGIVYALLASHAEERPAPGAPPPELEASVTLLSLVPVDPSWLRIAIPCIDLIGITAGGLIALRCGKGQVSDSRHSHGSVPGGAV